MMYTKDAPTSLPKGHVEVPYKFMYNLLISNDTLFM